MARRKKEQEDSVVLGKKGVLVVPKSIRNKLGLKEGSRMKVYIHGKSIVLQPQTREYFESLAGFLSDDKDVLKELLNERKRESER